MTWSERLKLTINTFKSIALPLYLWYLLFLILFSSLVYIFYLLPLGKDFIQYFNYLDQYQFSAFTQASEAIPSSSSNILESDLFLEYLPAFIFSFTLLLIFGLLETSLIFTGTFHLTNKGLKGKAFFRDFRFTGVSRMIGWHSFLLFLFLLTISIGIFLIAVLSIFSENLSLAFI